MLSSDSDSEHSAEDPAAPGELVIPGGEVLPGGFMDENVEVPVLQHIPEDNQEEAQPQPPPQNKQPEPANPEANPNQADNNMAAQGVQGSQISSIPVFSGIAGLDGAAYADASTKPGTNLDGQRHKLLLLPKPAADLL